MVDLHYIYMLYCIENIPGYLQESSAEVGAHVLDLGLVPSHAQECDHVSACCKGTLVSARACSRMHVDVKKSICLPAFDMYFVEMAILERKALACSTSSPRVQAAFSWNPPPHLIYWARRHSI